MLGASYFEKEQSELIAAKAPPVLGYCPMPIAWEAKDDQGRWPMVPFFTACCSGVTVGAAAPMYSKMLLM